VSEEDGGERADAVFSSSGAALLDSMSAVRCWGDSANGKLGIGITADIGDNEAPGFVLPVPLPVPARPSASAPSTPVTG
jgi:hypothetical protein